MTKHESCATLGDFADAKEERAFIMLEARRIVLWAGSLIQPGEEIGGIQAQLDRAARLLQLHTGVVWRAYQKRSGPDIFPTIQEARNKLLERIAQSPWNQLGHTTVETRPARPTVNMAFEPGRRVSRCG